MQLYNYQDIINKQPINQLCKKNDIYFYEVLVFKYRVVGTFFMVGEGGGAE